MKPENQAQQEQHENCLPLEWRGYSLDDFLDVERHLDRVKFPARFAALAFNGFFAGRANKITLDLRKNVLETNALSASGALNRRRARRLR